MSPYRPSALSGSIPIASPKRQPRAVGLTGLEPHLAFVDQVRRVRVVVVVAGIVVV